MKLNSIMVDLKTVNGGQGGGGWAVGRGVLKIKELRASCLIIPRSFQIRGLLSYRLKLLLPMLHTNYRN